jgi:hypothetical protein
LLLMKRLLSRHMVVALLVLTTSVLGGLSLAVVAFGQATSADPDATVPTGDFTGTTPAGSTAPLSGYSTTTTPTTTTVATTPTTSTSTTRATTVGGSGSGSRPARAHGRKDVTMTGTGGNLPSRATGRAPTKLAFTGGEPILIGGFGAALMLTGVALHERRRRRAAGEL